MRFIKNILKFCHFIQTTYPSDASNPVIKNLRNLLKFEFCELGYELKLAPQHYSQSKYPISNRE